MKKLTVWLLQTGQPIHIDPGTPRPMRMMNLADALVAAGHDVVLWSSAFDHREKRHRTTTADNIKVSDRLEIRLIPSPGYDRNIGAKRLWDHAILARNLKRLLRVESAPPDVAFVGYPPIETAAVITRWLKDRNVPTMLDVKDLWPALFLDAFPRRLKGMGRLALAPYYYMARRAMRDATGIAAMSEGFVEWVLKFSGRERGAADRVVPLSPGKEMAAPAERLDADRWWDERGIRLDSGVFRVIFVGSHISGFDFEPIREAAAQTAAAGRAIEFVLCGDGPLSAELRGKMAGSGNVRFPGWINLEQLRSLAGRSQVALAPYRNIENFMKNLPNKIIDSLSLGLPIVSPLEGEVASLITEHEVGLRYGRAVGRTLADCVTELAENLDLQRRLAGNARALFEREFSYENVYGGLVKHLERISGVT